RQLEDRTTPAVFSVITDTDNGGVNPAPFAGTGTLRQAIVDAAATSGTDDIIFTLPPSNLEITLAGSLTIDSPVNIDGWFQGGSGYTGPPLIIVNGNGAA